MKRMLTNGAKCNKLPAIFYPLPTIRYVFYSYTSR